jgi:uncharacterized protein
MIQRQDYLNKLIKMKDKKIIKIVTGIRRCGKSTMLKLFMQYLLESGINEKQIIFINFEDIEYDDLTDYKVMYTYIKNKLVPEKMNYLFLDEIQNVDKFQKAVDSLFIKENIDIYLTGSNAYMLSGEIATLMSGRYIEIKMLPLSFKEYKEFCTLNQGHELNELNRLYMEYITFGSFPYVVNLHQDKELISDYLMGIYNTVLLKDIIQRRKIADAMMLESVVKFIFDNIGNIFSAKKISDTMTSVGRKISPQTVEGYLAALLDSYIIYKANRYDVKGKQYLKTQEKYYVTDIGLRYFLLGSKSGDSGHILENIIYLQLLRQGYEVYIGKVDDLEIDFVTQKHGEMSYYQVALSVRKTETLERELKPLEKIPDFYPKYLITLDEDPETFHNGIKQVNVVNFLLK